MPGLLNPKQGEAGKKHFIKLISLSPQKKRILIGKKVFLLVWSNPCYLIANHNLELLWSWTWKKGLNVVLRLQASIIEGRSTKPRIRRNKKCPQWYCNKFNKLLNSWKMLDFESKFFVCSVVFKQTFYHARG